MALFWYIVETYMSNRSCGEVIICYHAKILFSGEEGILTLPDNCCNLAEAPINPSHDSLRPLHRAGNQRFCSRTRSPFPKVFYILYVRGDHDACDDAPAALFHKN
jgi:hypothetical protein